LFTFLPIELVGLESV